MAVVTRVDSNTIRVDGEYDCVYVIWFCSDVSAETGFQVINSNEYMFGVYDNLDIALEWAKYYADTYEAEEPGERDDEFVDFASAAEADADVLASAGWGTDEDYGAY